MGRMPEFDRDRRRKSKTLSGRYDSQVGLLQGLGREVGFLLRQLASPHLLPEGVGAFGEQEVRRDKPVVEQELGVLAIGLGNDPFDCSERPKALKSGRRLLRRDLDAAGNMAA